MMTKKQLREAVARFVADPNRVISVKNLCEIAGISDDTFRDVFKFQKVSLTVTTQIRVERALEAVKRGEVKVQRLSSKHMVVGYRRKPEPEFARGYGLTMKNGRIAVRTGLVNVNDYTRPTFEEELWQS